LEQLSNAGLVRKSGGSGTSYINAQFNNTGTVEADEGTINFQNGIAPNNGELAVGLNSLTDFGKIDIPGNATLGGTIGVRWLGGYVPATNDSFTILTYGSHSGIFTGLDLPPAALWATNYTSTSFTLTVASIDKLAFTQQPLGGVLTNVSMPPFTVQIEHPIGDPVPKPGVAVTLSLVGGTGNLLGTLTRLTDASGQATFNDVTVDQAGFKRLMASAPNLTPVSSASFRILPLIELLWTTNGLKIRLNGNNTVGPLVIQASTDLAAWVPIYTNPPTSSPIIFLDPGWTNFPTRFYRFERQ
jgi:hypothetical protein